MKTSARPKSVSEYYHFLQPANMPTESCSLTLLHVGAGAITGISAASLLRKVSARPATDKRFADESAIGWGKRLALAEQSFAVCRDDLNIAADTADTLPQLKIFCWPAGTRLSRACRNHARRPCST
jgi:hypothetical protein